MLIHKHIQEFGQLTIRLCMHISTEAWSMHFSVHIIIQFASSVQSFADVLFQICMHIYQRPVNWTLLGRMSYVVAKVLVALEKKRKWNTNGALQAHLEAYECTCRINSMLSGKSSSSSNQTTFRLRAIHIKGRKSKVFLLVCVSIDARLKGVLGIDLRT